MGGKPKTNTPKDMRLKANNPNAGATNKTTQPTKPAAPKKTGGKQS